MPSPPSPPIAIALSAEGAEECAIQALSFLARDDGRLRRFLKISGLEPETIRAAAQSRAFLLGVLDYLALDETLLRTFAGEDGVDPRNVMAARTALAPRLAPAAAQVMPSVVVECEGCDRTSIRRRVELPYAPPAATKLRMHRCGKCGGGFDQIETWFDRRGNEID